MQGHDEAPQGLDLPRLAAAVSARKRWILWPTCIAFVGAALFCFVAKPSYTATAKVLLQNGESYFTRPDKATAEAQNPIDDLAVESEAEAAKSPDVERKALDRLNPADQQEFSGAGWLSLFSGAGAGDERKLITFGKRADIYAQAKTRVLLFEFTSVDPKRAARAANALAQAYLQSQQGAKDDEAKSASKWLSDQIDQLRLKVATAESRVEALRSQSGLLASTNGMAVPSQQLSEISAQIASARAAQAAASSKAAALRDLVRAGRLDDTASVANDDSLRRYAEARVAVKAQTAELSRTLLPGHPRMKELAGQLAGLDEEIRAAAMKRVRGLEEDARIAADQVASLQQAVAAQAKTVTASDADAVKLRELEIDAKTARDQLESYLTKYREAIARDAENAVPANGRIIAYALAPIEPSFPKTGSTLLLAPLAAFFVSLGLTVASILLADPARATPVAAAPVRSMREAPEPLAAAEPVAAVETPPLVETAPVAASPASVEPLSIAEAPARIEPTTASESVEMETRAQEEAMPAPAELTLPAPEPREGAAWIGEVKAFVERLTEASAGQNFALLVAGEGETGALPAALVAARRLAREGRTALVDLGPSPTWLSDLYDHEHEGEPFEGGLSELVAHPEAAARIMRRDLSSELDILPSGAGETSPDDLSDILETLGEVYPFVVVHAADWRDEVARRAAEEIAAMLLVVPADAPAVEAKARAAYIADGLAVKAIATDREPIEREAA